MRRCDMLLVGLAVLAASLLLSTGGQPAAAGASTGAPFSPLVPGATVSPADVPAWTMPQSAHETPTPTRTVTPTRTPTLSPTPTFTPTPTLSPTPSVTPTPGTLPMVRLRAPAHRSVLPGIGPAALSWDLPAGATQYQVQVLPANGDGPGLNLIRSAESSYTIPAPVLGQGPYILLPGMRYIWRVRATDKTEFAPENDPAWGQWSEFWAFWTPRPTSAGLAPESPPDGGVLSTAGTQLIWKHSNPALFYYEVQVSGDTRFDPNPATATSFVWWNLVHGGVTEPPNSWRTPPLQPGTTYYWRVRPRVQGDGTPVTWGPTWRFSTSGALVTPTPTPTPSQTPAPGARIAFVSYRDGAADLYTMNSDGRGVKRLTTDGKIQGRAVWSADGTKLAFVTTTDVNREIYLVDADGSNLKNFSKDTATDDQPSWSANGARLVWVSTRDGNPELYTMFTDGTGFNRLTNTGAAEEQPVWAPDNAYIAFVSMRDGNREIYVMPANGGEASRLTLHDARDEQPAWSPDSSRIAFVSYRDGNRREIYVLDRYRRPEDVDPVRLTDTVGAENYEPVWSPDGKKIAFISTRDGGTEVYVMNSDGSNQTRLTNTVGMKAINTNISWSPDSQRIVFASNRFGETDIYVMNADGSNQMNITNNNAADLYPSWAPQ